MASSNVVDDYVAGAIAGTSGMLVGHPLDTLKVLLQTQQHLKTHRGMISSVVNMSKHGLAHGYFQGLSFPLASVAVVNAVYFGVYGDVLIRLQKAQADAGAVRLSNYANIFIAGCAAGLAQTVVAGPAELLKVVLQSQLNHNVGSSENFHGPRQALLWLYRHYGILGVYRGYTVFVIRDVPAAGLYVTVFDFLYSCLYSARSDDQKFTDSRRVFASLVAGGVAGVISWMPAVPFDVIKSLIQADVSGCRYGSQLECVRTVYRANGIRGFFSGLSVICFRAFPVNAIIFFVYIHSLDYLQDSGILHMSYGS